MALKAKYFMITAALAVLWLPLASFRSPDSLPYPEDVKWSKTRRLTWKDFMGPVNPVSSMRAETYSRIEYTYSCRGGQMQAVVVAKFVPEKSWVKPDPSERLLKHEQGHFDITEYYARLLRKHFETLDDGCDRGRDYVDAQAQALFKEWDETQEEYDEGTDHGRDSEQQELWLKRISNELSKMEMYSAD